MVEGPKTRGSACQLITACTWCSPPQLSLALRLQSLVACKSLACRSESCKSLVASCRCCSHSVLLVPLSFGGNESPETRRKKEGLARGESLRFRSSPSLCYAVCVGCRLSFARKQSSTTS